MMRPIDFVVFGGDSKPNDPAYAVAEALMKPLKVVGPEGELVILSYYMTDDGMVLDVCSAEDAAM